MARAHPSQEPMTLTLTLTPHPNPNPTPITLTPHPNPNPSPLTPTLTRTLTLSQELTLTVRNSHLSSALLLELQDECGINANAADFSRLELHTNPFLEKQMQLLIECVDDLQQEQQSVKSAK